MAGSVNKVILIGNLGRDPEVRTFQNGGKVVQAVHHAKHPNILGVQFHPESVGTKGGAAILRAFLEM